MIKKFLTKICLFLVFFTGLSSGNAEATGEDYSKFPFKIDGKFGNILKPAYLGSPYVGEIELYPVVTGAGMVSYAGNVVGIKGELVGQSSFENKTVKVELNSAKNGNTVKQSSKSEDFGIVEQSASLHSRNFIAGKDLSYFFWKNYLKGVDVVLTATFSSWNPEKGEPWDKIPQGRKVESNAIYNIPVVSFLQDFTSGKSENVSDSFKVCFTRGENPTAKVSLAVENVAYESMEKLGLQLRRHQLSIFPTDKEYEKFFKISGDSQNGWFLEIDTKDTQAKTFLTKDHYSLKILESYNLNYSDEVRVVYDVDVSIVGKFPSQVRQRAEREFEDYEGGVVVNNITTGEPNTDETKSKDDSGERIIDNEIIIQDKKDSADKPTVTRVLTADSESVVAVYNDEQPTQGEPVDNGGVAIEKPVAEIADKKEAASENVVVVKQESITKNVTVTEEETVIENIVIEDEALAKDVLIAEEELVASGAAKMGESAVLAETGVSLGFVCWLCLGLLAGGVVTVCRRVPRL